jgi:hypothetical protein
MRHWVTRVLVLAYALAWFGVVVPGHQRGVISFGQNASAVNSANLPPCHQKKQDPGAPATPKGKSGVCAICMMAAMTSPPPAVDSVPQPALRESLVLAQPRSVFTPNVQLPSTERGPPTTVL